MRHTLLYVFGTDGVFMMLLFYELLDTEEEKNKLRILYQAFERQLYHVAYATLKNAAQAEDIKIMEKQSCGKAWGVSCYHIKPWNLSFLPPTKTGSIIQLLKDIVFDENDVDA